VRVSERLALQQRDVAYTRRNLEWLIERFGDVSPSLLVVKVQLRIFDRAETDEERRLDALLAGEPLDLSPPVRPVCQPGDERTALFDLAVAHAGRRQEPGKKLGVAGPLGPPSLRVESRAALPEAF